MRAKSILVRRPVTLSLAWRDDSRKVFPFLELVARRWDEWLAANTPTDEQLYRKVLLDLWVVYRACNHQGSSMVSEGTEWGAEFNACTGKPLTSTRDYVEQVWPLVSALTSAKRVMSSEDIADAMFTFLLDGVVPGQDTAATPPWGSGSMKNVEPILFYKVNEQHGEREHAF